LPTKRVPKQSNKRPFKPNTVVESQVLRGHSNGFHPVVDSKVQTTTTKETESLVLRGKSNIRRAYNLGVTHKKRTKTKAKSI
jgi:hypothetical protein